MMSLPDARQAKRAVVILRMHGRSRIGSTFLQILERYAGRLQANDGKIILSGVSQKVWEQLLNKPPIQQINNFLLLKNAHALALASLYHRRVQHRPCAPPQPLQSPPAAVRPNSAPVQPRSLITAFHQKSSLADRALR